MVMRQHVSQIKAAIENIKKFVRHIAQRAIFEFLIGIFANITILKTTKFWEYIPHLCATNFSVVIERGSLPKTRLPPAQG